jgi:anti-sigma factor RsiW
MDHGYIDAQDVAGRYLRKELPEADREAFEAHLVDCAECADRVLLAEMFEKAGEPPRSAPPREPGPVPAFVANPPKLPLRARVIAYLTPWQIAFLLILGVVLILAAPGIWIWWELNRAHLR